MLHRGTRSHCVLKRLNTDAPYGFLLSGGLDSSLVCAIAQSHSKTPLTTFAIGLDRDPIDLKYAKQVADYLGTNHHEVIISQEDILNTIEKVIWHIESWDVTSIRSGIPMYLLCQYIKSRTSIKVVLSGEASDELFGYKYTDFAPGARDFQLEAQKRIKELYMFQVLRADRCIAAHGLEGRFPFADREFVAYVMDIDPELKLNKYNMGKFLLRKAFEGTNLLPDNILFRDKAAFSDAAGHDLVVCLDALAERKFSEEALRSKISGYKIPQPVSKEALMYREIFNALFPGQEHVINGYWLPNKTWPNCNLTDPSARFLPNYGASGI